ncbi:MAG: hypothetical protein O2839_02175 [Cyanobacteria bacterium]|nr:hypothetical protein [Cyanobacteriota bacterium]MDA1246396.1 hypothetical protein [Cyanobacteriota bacterium]
MDTPFSSKQWRKNPPTTEEIVSQIVDWSILRIVGGLLDEGNALAIAQEFAEWLEPEGENMEIFCLDANQ